MARIILEPNESFEHFHSEDSTTTLLQGNADYSSGETRYTLQHGVSVLTPGSVSHTITNTGDMDCMFNCGHGGR